MLSETNRGFEGDVSDAQPESGNVESLLRSQGSGYLPEELAPPVDMDKLRALSRRELSPERERMVHELCASFRSWDQAYTQVLQETQQRSAGDERSETNR